MKAVLSKKKKNQTRGSPYDDGHVLLQTSGRTGLMQDVSKSPLLRMRQRPQHRLAWGACELGRQGAKVVLWRTIVYDAESMGRMHTQGLEVFSRFFTLHIFLCRSFVNVYLQQSLRSYVGAWYRWLFLRVV
jgi:hypothetical protein